MPPADGVSLVTQTVRSSVSNQVKVFFKSIVGDEEDTLTVLTKKGERHEFERKSVLKICYRWNYVLIRRKLAREMGLL